MSLCVVVDRATKRPVGLRMYGSLEEARRHFPNHESHQVVEIEQFCEATEDCWAQATTTALDPDVREGEKYEDEYRVVPICGTCRGVDEHGELVAVADG